MATGWGRAEVAMVRVGGAPERQPRTVTADETGRFSFANVAGGTVPRRRPAVSAARRAGGGSGRPDDRWRMTPTISCWRCSTTLRISGLVVFRGDTAPPAFGKVTRDAAPARVSAERIRAFDPDQVSTASGSAIDGLIPGRFRIGRRSTRIAIAVGGWWLQSVIANGVELLDATDRTSRERRGRRGGVCDRASEVSGRVTTGGRRAGQRPVGGRLSATARRGSPGRAASRASCSDSRRPLRDSQSCRPATIGRRPRRRPARSTWFDPAARRALSVATPVTIAGPEKKTVDLHSR
jgi:hypothetical protein